MENNIYGVLFKNNIKPYYFKANDEFIINDEVIVETEKGEQFGKIVSIINKVSDIEYKDILRHATEEDKNVFYKNVKDAEDAVKKAKAFVNELNLDMYIINASFNMDRSQLLINFSADERVDFRELAKKLAFIYKTRIELRQIGARDKAKQVGAIGVCGQVLCCSTFLNQIDSISMNKAKNQNLALNPSKINGLCGRLLCCLCYEDDEYTRCSKGLLPIGTVIKYDNDDATIVNIDILSRTYTVIQNDLKFTIKADELNNDSKK